MYGVGSSSRESRVVSIGGTLAIVALAAALRLPALGRDPLWIDEATVARAVAAPWPEMLRATAADNQAPGFMLLARASVSVLGPGEAAHRLPSALAGIAAVGAIIAMGWSLAGRRTGLVAGLLLAVQPLAVHYSREARSYALLSLVALLALAALVALERRPGTGRAVLAGAVIALLPLTHATGAFLAVPLGLAFIARAWRAGPRPRAFAVGAAALAMAAWAPWLSEVVAQAEELDRSYDWARLNWDRWQPWQVPASLAALSPGAGVPAFNHVMDLPATAVAGAVLCAVLAAIAIRRRRPLAGLLAGVVLAALVTTFAISLSGPHLHVVGRVECAVAPLAMLLVALGAASLRGPVAWALAGGCVLLSAPSVTKELTSPYRLDSHAPVDLVTRLVVPGDVVIVTSPWLPSFEHYLPRRSPGVEIIPFPAETRRHPHWYSRSDIASIRSEARILASGLARHPGRVVLVLQAGPAEELTTSLEATRPLLRTWPLPRLDVEVHGYGEVVAEP